MDSKKLEALFGAAWTAGACCGSCKFGEFARTAEWGTCGNPKNNYVHNKHQRVHKLPAHVYAVCRWHDRGKKFFEIQNFLNSDITS